MLCLARSFLISTCIPGPPSCIVPATAIHIVASLWMEPPRVVQCTACAAQYHGPAYQQVHFPSWMSTRLTQFYEGTSTGEPGNVRKVQLWWTYPEWYNQDVQKIAILISAYVLFYSSLLFLSTILFPVLKPLKDCNLALLMFSSSLLSAFPVTLYCLSTYLLPI